MHKFYECNKRLLCYQFWNSRSFAQVALFAVTSRLHFKEQKMAGKFTSKIKDFPFLFGKESFSPHTADLKRRDANIQRLYWLKRRMIVVATLELEDSLVPIFCDVTQRYPAQDCICKITS